MVCKVKVGLLGQGVINRIAFKLAVSFRLLDLYLDLRTFRLHDDTDQHHGNSHSESTDDHGFPSSPRIDIPHVDPRKYV
jgi:hypothetical protein